MNKDSAVKSLVVVSRFAENVSWIDDMIRKSSVDRVIVYNKGSSPLESKHQKVLCKTVPNVGREGGTYLDYIIENYENLPERIWFTQGHPFEHSPNFVDLVAAAADYDGLPFQCMTFMYKPNYIPPPSDLVNNTAFNLRGNLCSHYFVRDMQLTGHCQFHDHGTELIMRDFESRYRTRDCFGYLCDRIGIARPRPICEFAYGACFYTTGQSIRRHPRWVYERAREFLFDTNEQGGCQVFILERFWPYLFSGTSYETLTDCYRSLFASSSNVAVYSKGTRRIWVKDLSNFTVTHDSDSIVVLFDSEGMGRHIPGINLVGPDKVSLAANSLEEGRAACVSFFSN